jgi:oxygen-independent coproporphyrinogen-3 oxidase
MKSRKGLYVHVPFCRRKCAYCDFYSVPVSQPQIALFMEGLSHELALKGRLWGGTVDSVYFGGGTPSSLEVEQVATALTECGRYFYWSGETEITCEVNPGTVDYEYLRALRSLGVNRLSIGLQSSSDELLCTLGRVHGYTDFLETYCAARRAGFDNISVDVMYGLPGQEIGDYLSTLKDVVDLGAEHVSAYSLQLEEGTLLHARHGLGEGILPEESAVVEMLLLGREYLLSRSYGHYEVSNYCLEGRESRHNLLYWHNEEYVGLGPGAASFVAGRRFLNVADLALYHKSLVHGKLPTVQCERLDEKGHRSESAILALRLLREGIDRQRFLQRYGVDPLEEFAEAIDYWHHAECLKVTSDRVILTKKGLLWLNRIQESFLP